MYIHAKNSIAKVSTDRLAECSLPLKKRKSLLHSESDDDAKKSNGPFECKGQGNLREEYCRFCSKNHGHLENHMLSPLDQHQPFSSTSEEVAQRLASNVVNFHSTEELSSKYQEYQPCRADEAVDSLYCQYCPMTFRSDYDRYVHSKLVHCTCRPFDCKICKQSFKLKSSLFEHEMFHINEKKVFKCHRCQMVFTHGSGLLIHRFAQDGLRPYLCSQCLETFESKHYLTNRNFPYMHTKQNFICDICTRSYKNKISLRSHMLTHMSKDLRTFKCRAESCTRSFEDCASLKKHLTKRHLKYYGMKMVSYTCVVCDQVFKNNDTLLQHEKSAHTDLVKVIDDEPREKVKFVPNQKLTEPGEESNSTWEESNMTHFMNGTLHLNENDGSFVIVGKRATLPETEIVKQTAEIIRNLSRGTQDHTHSSIRDEGQMELKLKDANVLRESTLKSERSELPMKKKRILNSKEEGSNSKYIEWRNRIIQQKHTTVPVINLRNELSNKEHRIRDIIYHVKKYNGKAEHEMKVSGRPNIVEKSFKRMTGYVDESVINGRGINRLVSEYEKKYEGLLDDGAINFKHEAQTVIGVNTVSKQNTRIFDIVEDYGDDRIEKAAHAEVVEKVIPKKFKTQRKNTLYRHECGFCCDGFKYMKDLARHILDVHNVQLFFHMCTDNSCKYGRN